MDEFIPVLLGFMFGGLIWRNTSGLARVCLSIVSIFVAGLAATVLSGEFSQSWIYLVADLAEACAGFAGAVAVGNYSRRIQRGTATTLSTRLSRLAFMARSSKTAK
jgi:hypothetical protein